MIRHLTDALIKLQQQKKGVEFRFLMLRTLKEGSVRMHGRDVSCREVAVKRQSRNGGAVAVLSTHS